MCLVQLVHLVRLVHLVHLVQLVHHVHLVHLVHHLYQVHMRKICGYEECGTIIDGNSLDPRDGQLDDGLQMLTE